jgi:AcrR family transcriptional regulator
MVNIKGENMTTMAQRQDSALTKTNIMDAAEKLFADKGFDGTGIMEIAQKAGVPKSLIYYYFENKDEILKELINRLVKEVIEMKYNAVEDHDPEDTITKEGLSKLFHSGYQFYSERIKMFKIIYQESLKKEFIGDFLMNIQMSQQESINFLKNAGMAVDEKELKFGHFFLVALPFMSFMLHRDKWCEMNDFDPDEAREKFINLMTDITTLIISRSIAVK